MSDDPTDATSPLPRDPEDSAPRAADDAEATAVVPPVDAAGWGIGEAADASTPEVPAESDVSEAPAETAETAETAATEATAVVPPVDAPAPGAEGSPAPRGDTPAEAPTRRSIRERATAPAASEETEVLGAVGNEDPQEQASPLEEFDEERRSRGGWIALTVVGVLIVLLGGAYVGGVFYTADRTPHEASIAGVEVGGMTRQDAVETLTEGIEASTTAPMHVEINDVEANIDPAEAGLAADPEASVAQLTGRSWDPRVVYERLFGSRDADLVTTVDADVLHGALTGVEQAVEVQPQDALITFADGAAVVTDPVDGSGLDVPAAVDVISSEWPTDETVVLPVTILTPTYDQASVDAAMATIVDPLLSAPVTVTAGEESAVLEPSALADLATLEPEDGQFVLHLDADALAETVAAALPGVGTPPTDASFTFVDGRPSVVPSKDGTGIDPAQLDQAVTAAALEPTGRTAVAELTVTQPEFTTADAEALGINEVIGEYSTPLPAGNDRDRTANIRQGAKNVTGVLLMPGETFSLIDSLGPIDGAHGFLPSGVVDGGNVSTAYGGGLSQLSTTLFNAGFEAGLEDITHKPHSRWFERYPAGREATMFTPSLDMQFRNRTDHGVLVRAWVGDDARVHVQLWGTKQFTTEITSSNKYNLTSSKTVYNTSSSCTPESGGKGGFTIDTRRIVRDLSGNEVENRSYTWTYSPWNKVVCGPAPSAASAAPADSTE